jgi:hypothetical protein
MRRKLHKVASNAHNKLEIPHLRYGQRWSSKASITTTYHQSRAVTRRHIRMMV